jgi:peptidoglycan hydrolase CwlO-like protein
LEIPVWTIQTFGVYTLITTAGTIAWAATITERINAQGRKIDALTGFAVKQDVDREIGRIEASVNKAHDRIDELQFKGA